MNWTITLKKTLLGVITFAAAYLAANPQMVLSLIPEAIQQMTIGSIVAGGLVGLNNWVKNKGK